MKFTLTFLLSMLPFAAQAQEGNEWKVEKTEWRNQRPANFQLAQAKPEAAKAEAAKPEAAKPADAPAAPAAAAAPQKEEDVQMSEDAIAKAKAEEESLMRKKAAEDAAAERQRQREVRLALCVIKPVMSDAEIELCRVAYRE